MDYELSKNGGVTKIALRGRLDAPSVERIEADLLASIEAGDRSAMVDLADVTFVSSVGIRMLLGATETLRRRHARLVLYGAQPLVAESLNLVIKPLIPLVDTESQALALLDA
jgi:anti-sigma B factor antagonist